MKILAVDISLVFSMAWEASEGKEFSAAFNRTIANVTAARQGFDRCMLAIDSGPSFRKQCPEYKANRTDRGEAYREQLKRTIDRLVADGCVPIVAPAVGSFPLTNAPSYAEADDVIGWACAEYERIVEEAGGAADVWEFVILSDDGDLEQLVCDDLRISALKSQLRGGEKWDEAKVTEKRLVPPEKIADLKALIGDNSDNYDGFCGELPEAAPGFAAPKRKPGIGPKGAASLIKTYGGALEIFDLTNLPEGGLSARWAADGVPPAVCATLARHGRAQAEKGLFLARIVHSLPGLDFAAVLAEPVVKPVAPVAEADLSASPAVELASPVEASPAPAVPRAETPQASPPAPADASPEQSAALAKVGPGALSIDPSSADWALSLQPRSASEAMAMARFLMNSRLYLKLGTAEAIWAIILSGRERGISAMIALSSIHIVEGKPEMSADLIVAQVLRSGKAKKFTCIETTNERAVYLVQRFDDAEPMRVEFTKEHAVARELWGKGNWRKMPDVMLAHRCATKAARLKFPDVTVGLYGEGEVKERVVLDAEFE